MIGSMNTDGDGAAGGGGSSAVLSVPPRSASKKRTRNGVHAGFNPGDYENYPSPKVVASTSTRSRTRAAGPGGMGDLGNAHGVGCVGGYSASSR